MQSLSLVMSECFLSGRGQGHVSNFYIVDLENYATASRRYTGDIGLHIDRRRFPRRRLSRLMSAFERTLK